MSRVPVNNTRLCAHRKHGEVSKDIVFKRTEDTVSSIASKIHDEFKTVDYTELAAVIFHVKAMRDQDARILSI